MAYTLCNYDYTEFSWIICTLARQIACGCKTNLCILDENRAGEKISWSINPVSWYLRSMDAEIGTWWPPRSTKALQCWDAASLATQSPHETQTNQKLAPVGRTITRHLYSDLNRLQGPCAGTTWKRNGWDVRYTQDGGQARLCYPGIASMETLPWNSIWFVASVIWILQFYRESVFWTADLVWNSVLSSSILQHAFFFTSPIKPPSLCRHLWLTLTLWRAPEVLSRSKQWSS